MFVDSYALQLRDNLGLIYMQTHQDNTNKAVCVLACGCIDAFVLDHVENRKLLKNTSVYLGCVFSVFRFCVFRLCIFSP